MPNGRFSLPDMRPGEQETGHNLAWLVRLYDLPADTKRIPDPGKTGAEWIMPQFHQDLAAG